MTEPARDQPRADRTIDEPTSASPGRARRQRPWVAALLVLAGAGLALVVVLAGFWIAGRTAGDPVPTVTRVDRVGNNIAVIRVDGAGATAAAHQSRTSAFRWVLVALGVALLPLAGGAWVVAGRLTSSGGGPDGGAGGPRAPSRARDEGEADPPVASSATAGDERHGAAPNPGEHERRRQLQDVVHELRTPLAVATTNLELAATTPGLDTELNDQLAAARRCVERLSRTIDDLSVHGRLVLGDDHGPLDLAVEARALAGDQAAPAQQRSIAVLVAAPGPLLVAADRAAVHTAVGNLLANAVRLAPAGSVIEVAAGRLVDWAWIAVRDEGPGLAADDHERAFRRYWRGQYDRDRADDRAGDGAGRPHGQDRSEGGSTLADPGGAAPGQSRGLGLTIARQVTEAQGGHLTVASTIGVGSTFVVWLPTSPEARAERVIAADGIHHRVDPLPARVTAPASPRGVEAPVAGAADGRPAEPARGAVPAASA